MKILKKIAGTIMLPGIMYVIMFVLCYANGKTYFGSWKMWQTLIPGISLSMACAFGIGIQFKAGRFDFSGGAIMLLSAIIAGNTAKQYQNNILLMCVLCIVICVGLSLVVGVFYVYGRLPIVIATMAMALIFEAVTCQIYHGTGLNLVSNMSLNSYSYYPKVLIPGGISIAVYLFYNYGTKTGKQSDLLSHNQQAAVNIGINENKNVIETFLFSGVIFGCAAIIYCANGIHKAAFSSLSTAGELFSNILPVFIGLMLAGYCGEAVGTIMGSITLSLLYYGLTAIFTPEIGTSLTNICTGVFILLLYVFNAQGRRFLQILLRKSVKTRKGRE